MEKGGDLGTKGRIEDADSLGVLLTKVAESFRVIPINPDIARLALELDFPHGDPFDRIITATAKTHAILVSTDDTSCRSLPHCDNDLARSLRSSKFAHGSRFSRQSSCKTAGIPERPQMPGEGKTANGMRPVSLPHTGG